MKNMMEKSFVEIAKIIETARDNSYRIIAQELANMCNDIQDVLSQIDDDSMITAECIGLEQIVIEDQIRKLIKENDDVCI